MLAALNFRNLRKIGLWYLAYEALSFAVVMGFGAYFTQIN